MNPSPRFLHIPSMLWLGAALTALTYTFVQAGAGFVILAEVPLAEKTWFLAHTYLWPGVLAFTGITLLQLQFRLSAAGQPVGVIFGMCVLASLTLLQGIQAAAAMPASIPAYVVGMAASYTLMSRVYAVHMRRWGPFSLPRVVWRGNRAAVAEMDRRVAAMRGASPVKTTTE